MVGAEVVAGDGYQLWIFGPDRSLRSCFTCGGLAAEQNQERVARRGRREDRGTHGGVEYLPQPRLVGGAGIGHAMRRLAWPVSASISSSHACC